MPRALLGFALCAVVVATADARSVRSGSAQRMTRMVLIDVEMVLSEWWTDGADETSVHLLSYGDSPPTGSRFLLIDEAGTYGVAVISEVAVQLDYNGAPMYYDATARWIDPPRRPQRGAALALGPTSRSLPRARVVPAHSAKTEDAPVTKANQSVWLTVDADGDQRADLTVAREECAGEAAARQQMGYYVECFRAWTRGETGWKSVDSWHRFYEED